VKRLYKSRESKVIDGVCGGIAEYYELDPVLIRLLAVLFLFAGGVTFVAYIVAMIIIPRRPWGASVPEPENAPSKPVTTFSDNSENRSRSGSLIIGSILVLFGIHFLMRNLFFFNPFYWWIWNVGWKYFWPCALICFGLFILYRSTRRTEK
jgi:phage shock protein C